MRVALTVTVSVAGASRSSTVIVSESDAEMSVRLRRETRSQYAHAVGRSSRFRETLPALGGSGLDGDRSRRIAAEQFNLRARHRRRLGIDNLDFEIGSRRRCQQE